ncbi:hypothetical protein PG991_008835 [Apiospora marii]|uniref:Uncharacterized protein n=1 Tax=Apiospora marii TaxID=335849 RepID=A0ABR1RM46_9PEZI
MSPIRTLVLASLAAMATADGLYVHSNELAAHFAKRQQMSEPGTPAYNCHDNCGQSIIASRGEDPCHDKTFLTDYAACLACAGPDNYGIWMYYGGALSKAASSCNLPTTPGTDKSTDVPVAIPAVKGSSTADSPTTTTPRGSTATTDTRVSTSSPSNTSGPNTASSASVVPTATASLSSSGFSDTHSTNSVSRTLC